MDNSKALYFRIIFLVLSILKYRESTVLKTKTITETKKDLKNYRIQKKISFRLIGFGIQFLKQDLDFDRTIK